ncbi:DNA mismatch repair protein, partial [Cryomyces antarcticus]
MSPASGRPLRLQRNTSTPGSESGNQWLPGFLDKWANPTFQNQTETHIPIASFDGPGTHSMEVLKGRRHHCTQSEIGKAFQDASLSTASRLSRSALKRAKLIAQVDRKFILVKMAAKPCDGVEEDTGLTTQMLVLIDQHAADERCKIESLLAELCQPATPVQSACRSGLGLTSLIKTLPLEKRITFLVSARELELFKTHAAFFAKWGILYDLTSSSPQPSGNRPDTTRSEHRLVVRTLPPSIAERCKIEPKHLIELLRTELWRRTDWALRRRSTRLITTGSDNRTDEVTDTENDAVNDKEGDTSNSGTATNSWLHRLADCPSGLIDLLKSRACRSAIMFNDVLSVADCQALLQRLAHCAFPFQCAHGRPSLVPLLELGGGVGVWGGFDVAAGDSTEAGDDAVKEEGFVGAWKRWRRLEAVEKESGKRK